MVKITNIASSFTYLQKIIKQSGPAMGASYTLIASVIILGTIGYFLDIWLDTSPILLLIGLLLGIVVGFYEIAKVIWLNKQK